MRIPTGRSCHVLFVDQAGERWTLGLKEPGSRTAPRRTNPVFTNLKQAEWHVFRLRLAALAGEELPIE